MIIVIPCHEASISYCGFKTSLQLATNNNKNREERTKREKKCRVGNLGKPSNGRFQWQPPRQCGDKGLVELTKKTNP